MLFTAFQIISQIVKSNHGLKIAVLFTLWASLSATPQQAGKAEGAASPEPVRPPKAGKPQAHCQGFAVGYYSFTLDALDLPEGGI